MRGENFMKIKSIKYPVPLSNIKDIENDNIDVFVEADDGMIYSLVVFTPKNYYWYMDKEDINYIPASRPDIIVRKLTDEIITEALETYIKNNGYWLKLYFLAGDEDGVFEIAEMDKMINKIKTRNQEIFGSD